MAYNSNSFNSSTQPSSRWNSWKTAIIEQWSAQWSSWKAAYQDAIASYYTQRIEQFPEDEAREYWKRLQHPQSGIDICTVSDAMLTKLKQELVQQGSSRFAADCFILELRRLCRSQQR